MMLDCGCDQRLHKLAPNIRVIPLLSAVVLGQAG
jgi:hypothetical protein